MAFVHTNLECDVRNIRRNDVGDGNRNTNNTGCSSRISLGGSFDGSATPHLAIYTKRKPAGQTLQNHMRLLRIIRGAIWRCMKRLVGPRRCADCGGEIGNDSGPKDGSQLEDGRTVCQACCVADTKIFVGSAIWHASRPNHDYKTPN
jgi:hypothetical protein